MVGCTGREPMVHAHKALVEKECNGKTRCRIAPTSAMFNINCVGWRRMWTDWSCDGGMDMTTQFIPPCRGWRCPRKPKRRWWRPWGK